MKTKRALVTVPTYNECKNITELVEQTMRCNDNPNLSIDLVIVDDNSPDGTGQIADGIAMKNKRVHVIRRSGKLGIGSAHLEGLKFGLKNGYDYLITMDADFSHNPKYIPRLIVFMDDQDVVIGSRYIPGGGVENCKLSRKIVSKLANTYIKTMLGFNVMDCTAGFRCYRRELLEKLDLNKYYAPGYSSLVEMLYRCKRVDAKIGEIPINFKNRVLGETKLSNHEIVKSFITVIHFALDRFGIVKQKHF